MLDNEVSGEELEMLVVGLGNTDSVPVGEAVRDSEPAKVKTSGVYNLSKGSSDLFSEAFQHRQVGELAAKLYVDQSWYTGLGPNRLHERAEHCIAASKTFYLALDKAFQV